MIAPQMQSGLTNRRTGPFRPQIKPVVGGRREGPGPDPNSFLSNGYGGDRNPLQHQAWWAQHGWDLGNNGRFNQAESPVGAKPGWNGLPQPPGQGMGMRQGGGYGQNGPGFDPNRSPGGRRTGGREGGGYGPGGMPFDPDRGRPGPGGPGGHNGGGPGGGGQHGGPGGKPGLPLDPFFESQRRILDDQLAAALQPLRAAREQVLASQALQGARLDTNEGVDTEQLQNEMAARGIFGSGIQNHDMGQLGTDYLRQRQDMANAVAGSLGDIASQRAGARGDYSNGLTELLLQLAQRSSADPYAVASMGGGRRKGGKGKGHHKGGKPGRRK